MQYRRASVLSQDIILVESQGMQHWLNMQLSKLTNVAMNISYPMPSRFIWDTARKVLGSDKIPRQSPYSREILTFRIEQIFHSEQWLNSDVSELVTQYWQSDKNTIAKQGQQQLKAFQLAQAVADVFEQYMLYRPDWIDNWQAGQLNTQQADEVWQQHLWMMLVEQSAYHPVALQDEMLSVLEHNHHLLPSDIHIFGINTMPPKTLEFFEVIAQWVNIHLYHLNPCVDYWGDIQTEKSAVKQQLKQLKLKKLDTWIQQNDVGHPLLANLGQQGKGFFASLQKLNGFEISAFDLENKSDSGHTKESADAPSCLQQVQRDILTLNDASNAPESVSKIDNSFHFVSCHNALREIEALHDFLLGEFAKDPSLTPRDVIVMCPAIEDYAPYIQSVFRSGRQQAVEGENTRLPCTIADRNQLDAQPIISIFLELLELPDSRFEVSKILDYLRLPAIQNKFNLAESQIETIEWWLKQANVHWGRDHAHKQQVTHNCNSDAIYTWQWAIERLLSGYGFSSEQAFTDDLAYMPHVEGQNALVLGQLCELLEQLQLHARELNQTRSAEKWHVYLTDMLADFFEVDEQEQESLLIIQDAINSLTERTKKAQYNQPLSLEVIRFYLQHQFSQADTSSQFLTGQITFCSMVPMRSIPFKVIAILGLNDGVYPRQQTPISFDLTQYSEFRMGDRSRRSDDRYLFLEALISARNKLYLSYQGRDVKNNAVREPSLILKELMGYLVHGYGWCFDGENSNINQMPLHAFNPRNFAEFGSYAVQWHRLAQPRKSPKILSSPWVNDAENDIVTTLYAHQLVQMFVDPFSYYCRYKLGLELSLKQTQDTDVEPFELDTLLDYQLTDSISNALIENAPDTDSSSQHVASVIRAYRLQGALPENIASEQQLEQTCEKALQLHQALSQCAPYQRRSVVIPCDNLQLSIDLVEGTQGTLHTRPTSKKAKDDLMHWLVHLASCLDKQTQQNTFAIFTQGKGESLTIEVTGYLQDSFVDISSISAQLANLVVAYQQQFSQPRLISIELMQPIFTAINKSKKLDIHDITALKNDKTLFNKWVDSVEKFWQQNEHFQWLYPDIEALTANYLKDYQMSIELFQPIYALLQRDLTL
ncbi:exodeoxyribonuclease V subunit gamma [Catenovulum agarivorans DS-2]|uniref:RecBCD enzyme subunit RecC n=2 Tax=Catenovulum agarivorans TaxID=1172192 RepID=W7R123_9ALTE|nr:exodeoxyribonuclease V subunit gamma [Catenovulum agarivorans DS-2]